MSFDESHINSSLRTRAVPETHYYGFLIPMLLEPQHNLQNVLGSNIESMPSVVGTLEFYNRDGLTPDE
jgi:hypothetical protein